MTLALLPLLGRFVPILFVIALGGFVALVVASLVMSLRLVAWLTPAISKRSVPGKFPMSKSPRSTPAPAATTAATAFTRKSTGTGLLASVKSWGYQLQKVNTKAVASSPFDLMVIDYSKDGSDEQAFTPGDIARMRVKPDGSPRLVIAYMSIGEAESYRYYWDPTWTQSKPSWLLDENPSWPENFAVCYWDPAWQSTFCGSPTAYLDKIIAAGFDGVYLDKCDVFEDIEERMKALAGTRPDLQGDMIAFIARLSAYAKAKKPTFTVIMQNAETLLEQEPLLDAIDGVAKESLLYGEPGPEQPNAPDDVTFARELLNIAQNVGRTVFVVEYLDTPALILAASATLDGLGYLATTSPASRSLDHLNPPPVGV